ncbi:DUF5711 family protein [Pseudoflavonifractor phocaeensis]|uniref:DUF5711 family protein n=1 Tax=Pseudoflavonifractor phocaeensis TaxID=1870988 RepID=UPI00195E283D|nr:DUF5711 family protein [Pseudoflavonifractor phocaeensis]MBM6886548.1 hypothetical protein [Pseudoflavonifractor phocaeensis]
MDEMNPGRKAPPDKKPPNLFVRFLAFLVTLALMIGAVALVVNYDKLNFDSLKRWFTYRNLERSESGQSESFVFEGGESSQFAVLDHELLVCSGKDVRLYSGSEQVSLDQAVSIQNPVVDTVGNAALVYDAGGQSLFVYRDRAEVFSLSLEDGQQLLAASMNSQGWLVVVSQESGYKGIVTVYDNTFSPQIQLHLSSRFVMDAVLSPDSKSLALLTLGLNDNAFESRVDFYQLNRTEEETEPDWTCPVGGDVILAMRWDNSGIWALGETSLSILSTDGTVTGSCNYGDLYLKGFSLDGDGTAVLLLGKFRAGTSAELWVVNADGETQALLSIEEQVLSLSAAGRYVALLTADRLDIYNQDLEVYSTLEGTQGAQTVLQQSDGSAMLIDSTTARLYVP